MRVGVIGPVAPDYFADNVGEALQHLGHTVTQLGAARFNPRGRLLGTLSELAGQAAPSIDERVQQRIVLSAMKAECDVIINLDARLMPRIVVQLKAAGLRVAFWFPDAVSNLGRQLMLLAPYDALFFKEPHLVDRLRGKS